MQTIFVMVKCELGKAYGWREDSGYRVYYFTAWAKARAMQHWRWRVDGLGAYHF